MRFFGMLRLKGPIFGMFRLKGATVSDSGPLF